ncbi:MAG: hypothetical protein LBH19_11940 [Dysgonamonadaceae bacterium]|jgi:hypothetical protein|nr:hypothetical protein [Dysgonamonadaceae bacterium]
MRKSVLFILLIVMSLLGVNAQGTWKTPAAGELTVAKGSPIVTGITGLDVTHNFAQPVESKSDADAKEVTYNGVTYDNKTIAQAAGDNGQNFIFTPGQNGTLDICAKMGDGKKTFVIETATDVATLVGYTTKNGGDISDKAYPTVTSVGIDNNGAAMVIPTQTWDASVAINTTGANAYVVMSFPVTAGKNYVAGCDGSKFQLVGIHYVPDGGNNPPASNDSHDWNFSNTEEWPLTSGYSEETTVNGLTLVPFTTGTPPTNFGAINANSATVDGVSYVNRFQFNGAGYGGASDADMTPPANMPTQRYLSFSVSGPVTIDIVGTTGSSSSNRKIFLTDGTDYIGSFDYGTADGKLKRSLNYTGGAATLYLFCNASCNIYHIVVSSPKTSVTPVEAGKEIRSVEYFDLLGRKAGNAPALKNTVVIKKTTYTDGTTSSAKVITKAY